MNPDSKSSIMNFRPLFVLALCIALGIVLGRYIENNIVYMISVVVFFIAAFLLRRKMAVVFLSVTVILLGVFISSAAFDVDYIEVNDDMKIEGRVIENPYVSAYGDTVIVLDNASIDSRQSGGIKLYLESDNITEIEPGDIIVANARVQIPNTVKNPGGYNEKLQYLTQGIYFKAYAHSIEKIDEKSGLKVLSAKTREYICSVIDDIFEDDVQAVAKAMLLGEKEDLDEQVYSSFKDTGMAHVLAVSGLHAGILIGAIYFLLKRLRAGRTLRLIITLIFIAIYACVTGLTPSIVRASIMAVALLLGSYFGRQSDSLNYLSIAFIISLLLNPLSLFSVGFALSFGAVFAIITIGWQVSYWFDHHTKERMRKVGGMISVSIGATAGTLPFLAFKFNRISTFSILTNIVVIPFASLAIVTVFITTLAGLIFQTVGTWFAYVSGFLVRILMKVIDWIASISFVAVDVASPPWYVILALLLILFITSKFVLIKTRLKAILSAGIVVVVVAVMILSVSSGMYLVFLDVGQADAAFIRTQQGAEYFVDGGREQSSEEIINFTIRNGYKPDAAFISHSDDDHFSGIKALYEQGMLSKVYCSYQEEEYISSELPEAEVVALCAGDVVWLDEVTTATVLYPYKNTVTDDKNEASLVLLVEYDNKRILFTGDISGATETQLFSLVGQVDIYKAAHHGSKYSSYLLPLCLLKPDYSIVSVGYNTFGHPHKYAMENLEEYSQEVYTTIDDYAVEFFIGDDIKTRAYGDLDG